MDRDRGPFAEVVRSRRLEASSRFFDALYPPTSGPQQDVARVHDEVETQLIDLLHLIEREIEKLSDLARLFNSRVTASEDEARWLESQVLDVNQALDEFISIRPKGAYCPVVARRNNSIALLKRSGLLRPERWVS